MRRYYVKVFGGVVMLRRIFYVLSTINVFKRLWMLCDLSQIQRKNHLLI